VIGGKLLDPDEPERWKQKIPPAAHIDLIFTDFLSLEDQRALYHLSSILLFPSLSDTLPLTIIEAMASGLPVIAYDVGGISFQLAENSGVLVEAGNSTNYLDAVAKLLRNSHQKETIQTNSQVRQKALFSWEKAAVKTIEIYEQLS
jgi:glycosyltransferase involved in cell wall biosynthesis